jgi:hypothetical protein
MMKAYARVEWVFLERMMSFEEVWISMVMRCVRSVRFSVKLNGQVSDAFSPSRGLRQGDPLSPYLFLFCVEGFSALLKRAQSEKELAGVGFGGGGPTVPHLLFADDRVVFLEASTGNLEALRTVLRKYELCSGQRVNLQKSSIYFGKGCAEGLKNSLETLLGVQAEALSERYLGLPTVVGKSKNGAFKYIQDRARGKVAGMKGQGLSKKGKEVLIKSVVQSVSTYPMGCFKMSQSQCKELSSISSGFWWGDSMGQRKVRWIS